MFLLRTTIGTNSSVSCFINDINMYYVIISYTVE